MYLLRPGDRNKSRYVDAGELPERRAEDHQKPPITLTSEFVKEYDAMPAAELRSRYNEGGEFRILVDLLLKERG